ncbi:hypothetical protein WME94_50620 [Sorangium sp. So ce429]
MTGLLLIALAVAVAVAIGWPREELHATFVSPDGRYQVDVYRRRAWLGVLPGQSSDAPGRVVLLDRSGRVLEQVNIEMVQLVDGVEWGEHSASIRAVVQWRLP